MPTISERGRLMPSSPIRKLAPLAEKAKERGVKVYHLNIGQPDLPAPPEAIAAIRNIDRTVLEYSPSEGFLSFRQKLAKYYHKFNIDVTADEIIITTGGSEAVTFAFMSCLDPGDEIIVPEPAYANYEAFAIVAGAVIKSIAAKIEDGFALPPVEEFEKLITPKTKGIMICNPNNPTGYLYTQEEMDKIRDLVKKYDLYLFSDEVYREFCYTSAPYISAFHLEGIEQNVVLIDSVSKRYSECGLRIGALITKNEEVRNYNEYVNRRKFLIDGLNRIDGVYSPIPMGAFYTVARLPVDNADKFCSWLLSDFQYENQTLFLAPASGFYTMPNQGVDQVRIAYVLKKPDLAVCLKILEEALKVYPGSKVRQAIAANGVAG